MSRIAYTERPGAAFPDDVPLATARMECNGPWRARLTRPHRHGGRTTVAAIVVFEDRTCAMRWTGAKPSTGVYESLDRLRAIHVEGHDGTVIEWDDAESTEAFARGVSNAFQSACENAPCADIGGLDRRDGVPLVPSYVSDADAPEWLRGYARACCVMWGDDWRTCPFSWKPAMVIGGSDAVAP